MSAITSSNTINNFSLSAFSVCHPLYSNTQKNVFELFKCFAPASSFFLIKNIHTWVHLNLLHTNEFCQYHLALLPN